MGYNLFRVANSDVSEECDHSIFEVYAVYVVHRPGRWTDAPLKRFYLLVDTALCPSKLES